MKIKDLINKINEESDVSELTRCIFKELYNITCTQMQFTGIPEDAAAYLRKVLIISGQCLLIKQDGNIIAAETSRGTDNNKYYIPQKVIVANPYDTEISKEYKVNADAAMIYLSSADKHLDIVESYGSTLYHMIKRYSWILANTIISINTKLMNSRVQQIAVAPEDADVISMETGMKKLYSGKPYIVVKDDSFLRSLNIFPTSSQHANGLQELIECYQYVKSQFLNSIGINSNFNMKRERLNTAEISTNEEYLEFSWKDVETTINESLDNANRMYGTDIKMIIQEHETEQSEQPEQTENEEGDTDESDS